MPLVYIVGIIAMACIAIFAPRPDGGNAMKVCELSHSHDVCFNTLNR